MKFRLPPPNLIRTESWSPRLRKHKRTHGNAQGPRKNYLAVQKGPQIAYSTRRSLARQAQITIQLAMQPADGVRRIHRHTRPVRIYRKSWAARPQVPECLGQALLVNTSHNCLTSQKLDELCRIVTEQMRLADAHIENKSQPPKRARASAHCWFGGCSWGTANREPSSSEKSSNRYTPPSTAESTYTNTGCLRSSRVKQTTDQPSKTNTHATHIERSYLRGVNMQAGEVPITHGPKPPTSGDYAPNEACRFIVRAPKTPAKAAYYRRLQTIATNGPRGPPTHSPPSAGFPNPSPRLSPAPPGAQPAAWCSYGL